MKIDIELTTKCNLSCPFCQKHEHKPEIADLSEKIWSNLPFNDIEEIVVCGSYGDPFWYPKIQRFIEQMLTYAGHCKINFNTNGNMFDARWWFNLGERFKNYDFWVQFGLDGLTQEVYQKYRVHGNYEQVLTNMLAYTNGGGKAIWQWIVFEHNQQTVEIARGISEKLGVKFQPIMSYKYDDKLKKPTLYDNVLVEEKEFKCQSIEQNMISIDVHGNVTPCCHTRPAKMVNFDLILQLFAKMKFLFDLKLSKDDKFFTYLRNNFLDTELCQKSCGQRKRYELKKNEKIGNMQ
jgi:pyruvate-formate lyase-activating enzyme